ncbi:hypothetical protein [Bacillus thuringiensis]|uniref:hypothetical protein n=1 Tax=Bacillus thuringiensis TaxID=1428 RepID=UPI0011A28F67|nr:hypothetical protein [Bacillus thuringiensis]
MKLRSGKRSGKNFVVIWSRLVFVVEKDVCELLQKEGVNLKKEEKNLLRKKNYKVKRLKKS